MNSIWLLVWVLLYYHEQLLLVKDLCDADNNGSRIAIILCMLKGSRLVGCRPLS